MAMPAQDLLADAQPVGVPDQPFAVGPVPDHVHDEAGMGGTQRGERVDEQVQPLVRYQPTDTDDGRPLGRPARTGLRRDVHRGVGAAGHDEARSGQLQDVPGLVPG